MRLAASRCGGCFLGYPPVHLGAVETGRTKTHWKLRFKGRRNWSNFASAPFDHSSTIAQEALGFGVAGMN